jgi:hypothetical protein
MDADADPGGPKTYGSCGSGSKSAKLAERIQNITAPKNTSCSGGIRDHGNYHCEDHIYLVRNNEVVTTKRGVGSLRGRGIF